MSKVLIEQPEEGGWPQVNSELGPVETLAVLEHARQLILFNALQDGEGGSRVKRPDPSDPVTRGILGVEDGGR